jgi:hypothetical protein
MKVRKCVLFIVVAGVAVVSLVMPARGHSASADRPPVTLGETVGPVYAGAGPASVPPQDAPGKLVFAYGGYLGGGDIDWGHDIAVDAAGNVYVAGVSNSADFPATAGAFNAERAETGGSAFVAKVSGDGRALEYVAYLGDGAATAIDVDGEGNAYVGVNAIVPVTSGSFGAEGNACVVKLNATGSEVVYAGCMPGVNGIVQDITLDGTGRVYVSGATGAGFPATAGAYSPEPNGGTDPFLAIISADGGTLEYATYLGGSNHECAWVGHQGKGCTVAVDGEGNAYVTGGTLSDDLPTTPGAHDTSCGSDGACNGDWDAFVVKLTPAGNGQGDLVYATYLGGEGAEMTSGIAVDGEGNAYVTGSVHSRDFPTTGSSLAEVHNGGHLDAFVVKLSADGSGPIYATYLGGGGMETGWDIALGEDGSVYAMGRTNAADFPTTGDAFATAVKGTDIYVVRLTPDGSGLMYGTYLGGNKVEGLKSGALAMDAVGNVYVTGETDAEDFPSSQDAFDTTFGGKQDAFAVKLQVESAEAPTAVPAEPTDEATAAPAEVEEPSEATEETGLNIPCCGGAAPLLGLGMFVAAVGLKTNSTKNDKQEMEQEKEKTR